MTVIRLTSKTLMPDELRTRVSACSGVCRPSETPADGGVEYIDSAFVPKADWRPVSDAQWDSLYGKAGPVGTTVYLSKVGSASADALRQYERGGVFHEGTSMNGSDMLRRRLEALVDEMPEVHRLGPMLGAAPTPANTGNLETLTRTYPSALRTGLHIDNWDRLPLSRRSEGSNRASVNLGQGFRHLLFSTLSVAEMWNALQQENGGDDNVEQPPGSGLLAARYMQRFPSTVIYRVKLLPGEVYFAPTENLLHDVSNAGSPYEDRTVQLRGFLMPAVAYRETGPWKKGGHGAVFGTSCRDSSRHGSRTY